MNPAQADRFFHGRFLILLASSLLSVILVALKLPVPALGNDDTHAQAYFLNEASVLFTSNPNLTATEVLSRSAKIPVSLPDSWDKTQPGFEGQGWYQIDFQLTPDKPQPNTLFLPRAVMNAHAYVNGKWIGGYGTLEGDITRHWNHPLLFHFSPELLKPGQNTILIQVAGYKNYRSGLGRIWVGPNSVLEPLYDFAYRWQVTGSMLASLVAFGSGLLLLIFSRLFQEQKGFFFLSLAVIVFAIRNTGYFMDWIPFPHALWGQLVHSLHAWFAGLYSLFLIRYMGLQWKWMARAMPAYAMLVTILTLTTGGDKVLDFTLWLLLPVIPVVFVLNLVLLRHAWKHLNFEGAILGCSSMIFVLLSIRDLSTMLDVLPVESMLISQYTGIMLFVAACWIIFRRYSDLLVQLKTVNQSLNSKLSLREQQLVGQFNLMRKIELQRTQDDERRRIMQDIHDGVGSSLVSALNLSETRPMRQEEMREVLQECLDDLRMAIDSLDPQSDDLLALLGNFRWRYERRLKASGVTLTWNVADVPRLEGYTSRDLFDLLRIVQEIFANSLKHAKATEIKLTLNWDEVNNTLRLCICDNGIGMPQNVLTKGRGLTHMKIRAKVINIDLFMEQTRGEKGVAVHMAIPRVRQKPSAPAG